LKKMMSKCLSRKASRLTIFELVDTIIKGGEAQHALVKLTSSGANPNYILFMLARQIRLLLRIKALEASGATEGEIRQKLAISSDFVWQKTKYLSQRYSLDELKEVYQRLLETDRSIKSGQSDPELALHLLVAELRLKPPKGSCLAWELTSAHSLKKRWPYKLAGKPADASWLISPDRGVSFPTLMCS